MKEKSTRHRDAIHKVAEAVDNALVAIVNSMDDDALNLDPILLQLAEARAYIVQAIGQAHAADVIESIKIDIENDQPRVYADEVGKGTRVEFHGVEWKPKDKLPKLKPQGHKGVKYKPGIGKLLRKAIEFDCPTCHAEAGTFCFLFTGPGTHTTITDQRNNGKHFHTKRTDLSTAANDRIRKNNILT